MEYWGDDIPFLAQTSRGQAEKRLLNSSFSAPTSSRPADRHDAGAGRASLSFGKLDHVARSRPHRLLPLVLGLELLLQLKVELALALDALLFHVADDALVHGLREAKRRSARDEMRWGGRGVAAYGFLGRLLEVHEDDGRRGEEGGAGEGELGAAGGHCGEAEGGWVLEGIWSSESELLYHHHLRRREVVATPDARCGSK